MTNSHSFIKSYIRLVLFLVVVSHLQLPVHAQGKLPDLKPEDILKLAPGITHFEYRGWWPSISESKPGKYILTPYIFDTKNEVDFEFYDCGKSQKIEDQQ